MSTYAIGDIQGCYTELLQLLDKINFDNRKDQLWLTGDIINRGPESLLTLRFIMGLGTAAKMVLGNHEFHLLAVANNSVQPHIKDTLDPIIKAEDSDQLLAWIRKQPLLINTQDMKYTMVHAGLLPQWSLAQSQEYAKETETFIQNGKFTHFLNVMYGNQPNIWSDSLTGDNRYRFIINCFTRMRYCHTHGELDFTEKGAPGQQSENLIPWYALPGRKTNTNKIIFGHWSTLHLGNEQNFKKHNVYPLDSGCVWGGTLTALRLEDEKIFSIKSRYTN